MALGNLLKTHPTWEDGAALFIGLVIEETGSRIVVLKSVAGGLAIMWLAQLELVHFRRWEKYLLFALGGWVTISTHALGYAEIGQLRIWHWLMGVLVMLLALLEIWQDWRKTDQR